MAAALVALSLGALASATSFSLQGLLNVPNTFPNTSACAQSQPTYSCEVRTCLLRSVPRARC
jgi:hypothetical protein